MFIESFIPFIWSRYQSNIWTSHNTKSFLQSDLSQSVCPKLNIVGCPESELFLILIHYGLSNFLRVDDFGWSRKCGHNQPPTQATSRSLLGLSHILHPRKVSVNKNGHSATRNSDLTHSRKNELESFTEVTSFILLFTKVSSAISF